MKKIIVIILLCLPMLSMANKGGRDSAIVVAKREFGNMRYAYAIPFYKRHVTNHPDDADAFKDLGYCYKINNQYDSAVYFYEKAFELGGVNDNILAELYATIGQYEKAVKAYDTLLVGDNVDTTSITYKLYKTRQRGFYNYTAYFQDTVDYKLYYLKVNTPMNEYSPSILDSGFVFESNRGKKVRKRDEFGWDGKSFTRLYFQSTRQNLRVNEIQSSVWSDKKIRKSISDYTNSSVNDNNVFNPRFDFKDYNYKEQMHVPLLDNSFKAKGNYGSITFTKDGKEAYFTKNEKVKNGISQLEIWTAKRSGKSDWNKFKKLNINEKGSSIFHPAITDDGSRLYFSSDQESGFGGTDIYYSEKESDGKWGPAINAGETINTAGNELFPTFYEGVLYFSSNGHGGLGGLDVFRYLPNENVVDNVGAPINSSRDDLGYSRKGEGGYFSSNRYGSDDVFEYEYDAKQIKILGKTLVNKVTKEGVSMKLYSIDKERVVDSTVTDAMGQYSLKGRPFNRYQLQIDDKNGHTMSKDVITEGGDKDMGELDVAPAPEVTIPEEIVPEEQQGVVSRTERGIENEVTPATAKKFVVYYDLDKSFLTKNDKAVLNELVVQMKQRKELNAVIGSFTDCSADIDYNIKLSNKRSAAVTRYLKDMGIAAGRIVESHYGKNYLVKQCEEGRYNVTEQLANRRSEIFVSEDKRKKWDVLNSEYVDPATYYSKDIEQPENLSNPSVNRRINAIQTEINNEYLGKEDNAMDDGKAQGKGLGDTILFVVYFNVGQYDLSNSFGTLSGLKDLMRAFKEYRCVLTGHTDNEGDATFDRKLSELRVATVRNYFVSYNIDLSRIKTIIYGSSKPAVVTDKNSDDSWKNRRVEVRLYK